MPGRRALVLAAALAAGLAQAASFWPFPAWWLQLLALAALVALLLRAIASPRARSTTAWGACIGFAFGFAWFAAGVSWVYVSMHRYGGMPAPLAALALLLFAAYLASFVALVAAAIVRCGRAMREHGARAPLLTLALGLLFAGLWTFAELVRGWLFTGFPWLAIGYAHVDGPLAGLAPLLGVYGVSGFAALCAFGIGAVLAFFGGVSIGSAGASSRARRDDAARAGGLAFVLALVLVTAPLAAGVALHPLAFTGEYGTPLGVRLVQGNVPQELKFDAAHALAAMHAYAAEVRKSDATFVILPETAWTVPWSRTPRALREDLRAHLADTGGVVAIGMPLFTQPADGARSGEAPDITNSVAVVDRSGEIVARYDKRHLVPFGEFVPWGFGWFVRLMEIPLGDFARGAAVQAPISVGGQRIGFDICFEDLFGEELAVQVRNGATILVNVSNIAWFGDSHVLPQHLQIARMRALELERPMLRATNTGVTAAIDASGRVLARLPSYTEGSLDVVVHGREGLTPYARYGNRLPVALAALLTLAGLAGARRSRRTARAASDRASQTR